MQFSFIVAIVVLASAVPHSGDLDNRIESLSSRLQELRMEKDTVVERMTSNIQYSRSRLAPWVTARAPRLLEHSLRAVRPVCARARALLVVSLDLVLDHLMEDLVHHGVRLAQSLPVRRTHRLRGPRSIQIQIQPAPSV